MSRSFTWRTKPPWVLGRSRHDGFNNQLGVRSHRLVGNILVLLVGGIKWEVLCGDAASDLPTREVQVMRELPTWFLSPDIPSVPRCPTIHTFSPPLLHVVANVRHISTRPNCFAANYVEAGAEM
jgi:hypothetical protein